MSFFKKHLKLIIGLFISLVFMYLALSKVNYKSMAEAFAAANYWYIIPGIGIMYFSYWLRCVRWKYLLDPLAPVSIGTLFNALLVGYMANSFLPAHLGEFIRAFLIGKQRNIHSSTVLGTIITERIIDIISLIVLMGITIIIFPFPDWVQTSGYILLAGSVVLSAVLIILKIYKKYSLDLLSRIMALVHVPQGFRKKSVHALNALLDGIVPLKNSWHYVWVLILTVIIWGCYAGSIQLIFYCFDLVQTYSLPVTASLVLLVITTISVVVPSSPGYVGTYHFLCVASLALFNVPKDIALSYAFVNHGMSFFPNILVGLIVLFFMKISLKTICNAKEETAHSNYPEYVSCTECKEKN